MAATPYRRVISADSHVIESPDLWWGPMKDRFGDTAPHKLDEYNGRKRPYFAVGDEVVGVPGSKAQGEFEGASTDPSVRLKFQAAAGVSVELLHPTLLSNVLRSSNRELVWTACQVYNDWLAEFTSHAPDRLVGIPTIPLDDPERAVQELQRTNAQAGLRGALIPICVAPGAAPYRDSVYDPFWAAAQEMGATVGFHIFTGGRAVHPTSLPKEAMGEAAGYFMDLYNEMMVTLANDFIFGRILDRFPTLKVMCNEFDVSWLPMFMLHIDRMQEGFAPRVGLPDLDLKASDYVRHRIWHGLIDDQYARHLVDQVGVSQIIWGSDYPHAGSITTDAHEVLHGLLEGVPADDQQRIVSDNIAQLMGF